MNMFGAEKKEADVQEEFGCCFVVRWSENKKISYALLTREASKVMRVGRCYSFGPLKKVQVIAFGTTVEKTLEEAEAFLFKEVPTHSPELVVGDVVIPNFSSPPEHTVYPVDVLWEPCFEEHLYREPTPEPAP